MVVKMVVGQAVVKLRHGPLCTGPVGPGSVGEGEGGRNSAQAQDSSLRFRASWGALIALIDVA